MVRWACAGERPEGANRPREGTPRATRATEGEPRASGEAGEV